jgi:hypothetical protein
MGLPKRRQKAAAKHYGMPKFSVTSFSKTSCVDDFFGGTGFANFASHSEFSATLVTGALLPVRK